MFWKWGFLSLHIYFFRRPGERGTLHLFIFACDAQTQRYIYFFSHGLSRTNATSFLFRMCQLHGTANMTLHLFFFGISHAYAEMPAMEKDVSHFFPLQHEPDVAPGAKKGVGTFSRMSLMCHHLPKKKEGLGFYCSGLRLASHRSAL